MLPHIIEKEELSSTNETLADILSECPLLAEGTVVSAFSQVSGKGQIGNHWESEAGKNLTFSLLLRPTFLNIKRHFYLSIVISLGVVDFLKTKGLDDAKVKWPNDVYVGNRKICGILIENVISGYTIETSIAGIGVNINQQKFLSDAPNPVSLFQLTNTVSDLSESLRNLLFSIGERYEMLRNGKFDALKSDYLSALYQFNEEKFYYIPERCKKALLKIIDVLDDGTLCFKDSKGEVSQYLFKEIEFLR